MYLKRITLTGFKSFADRISLNFEKHQIAGIVGPNGSGKSNVIDAVRWVMGEQNAKMLRGEKATDIIFSGSEKRKALGMAEVTLVFDNKDVDSHCPEEYRYEEEVSLTRRLYLDGQREFLINKRPCRLKDIISFFVASGIGGRSYSMIQQGQVDRILQAKPEQLREIVEEAAGIVIFKKKHDETKKKLDQTQQNIDRLSDISKEVDTRLGALEEQATKARKWKEHTENLAVKEREFVTQSFFLHHEKKQKLAHEVEEAELKRIEIESGSEKFHIELEEFKKQLAETDPELSLINEEITKVRESLASSETRLIGVDASLESSTKRIEILSEEVSGEEKALQDFNERHESLEEEYKKSKNITENAEQILEDYQSRIDNYLEQELVTENKIEELRQELLSTAKELDAAELRYDAIRSQVGDYKEEKESYSKKLMGLENEHSQVLILVDSATVKLKNKENELDARKLQQGKLEETLKKSKDDLERVYSNLETCKHKYIEASTRYNHYKDMKHWTEDIDEWFSELPDKEQEKVYVLSSRLNALGAKISLEGESLRAFENWSERIVAEDFETLDFLEEKARELGVGPVPVSFLPEELEIDSFDKDWALSRGMKPLSDFVKVKNKPKFFETLFSRVYITEESSLSEEDLKEKPASLIVFTASSYVYSNGFDFDLGLGQEDSALSLERQKEELDEKVKKCLERVDEESKKQKTLKEKSSKIALELNQLIDEQHSVKQEHLALLGDLQSLKQKANAKQEQIQTIRVDLKAFVEKNEALEKEKESLENAVKTFSTRQKEYESEEADLKEIKEDSREKTEEIKTQLEAFKYDKISAETKLQTFEISYNQNKEQLGYYKERLKKLVAELADAEKVKKESDTEKKELSEKLKTLFDQKEKLETLLSNKKSENSTLTEAIKKTEKEIKKAQTEASKFINQVQDRKNSIDKLEFLLESVREMAKERCHIETLESLKTEKNEEFNAQNTQRQISSLKSKIEGIGPINMMAVEEYDELSKRKEFINAQKEEVYAAINLLELAIDEITKTSEKKFTDAFVTLNSEFKELFPVLFPRGKGELTLTDAKKPLESGVEIMVRLPGKSFQNMRLFSGGEKALTAIALIFALLKSKPTPFCFLDEVDAALDEANVGHYNRLLDSLSDRFQFIVITHRRGTMEVLDTLYGVTMQEPGVSKVVGVDLSKSLPAHLQKAFKEKEALKKPDAPKKPEYVL